MCLRCRICGNSEGNTTIVVREMMFGSRDPFDYLVCAVCGCIQIAEVPKNLSDYYPSDARSYKIDPRNSIFTKADVEAFEARARRLNAAARGDQAAFYLRKTANP
jgi:hypothetical protein